MKAARRAVGDDGSAQRVIRTIHGRGYQFVASIDERPSPPTLAPALDQEVRFCVAPDGVRIAFATAGAGPPRVRAAHWLTHIDHDWASPVWRHWLEGLAHHHTLVRYDERGCGLSDWDVERFEFDAWVEDLELVVDTIGLERFPLVGTSQGGAVAIAYADTDEARRQAALDLEVARVGFRRNDDVFPQVFTTQFLPDGTHELWQAFNTLQRLSTSPDT